MPTSNYMKVMTSLIHAAIAGGCFVWGTIGTAQQTLTLEQAKLIAVERNAGLKAFKDKSAGAHAREGRAASGFYPTIETRFGTEQETSDRPSEVSNFGYLVARWNLYRGGLDFAKAKTSKLESELVKLEFQNQQMKIENEVEEVFSKLLFSRDIARIKERFIELNTKQQGLAKQVAGRGGASQSDVVEFDLRAATLRSELAGIEQEYRGNLVRLKALIGEDIAKNPRPLGELPHQHINRELTAYANLALKNAPSVAAATLALDIAAHQARATRGRWLPQVDLEGRFGALPGVEVDRSGTLGSTVAVVATWELFGGFDSYYQSQEASAAKSQADWQLKADINTLLAEIEANFGEIETIQKRADLEKDNVRSAQRYYELVFSDFKRGYKNSGDLNSAAQTWYDSEVHRKQLDLDFIEKKLILELKIGQKIASVAMKDVNESDGGGGNVK